ncbi:ISL3 family transposase [Polymorphospora sp. A560]
MPTFRLVARGVRTAGHSRRGCTAGTGGSWQARGIGGRQTLLRVHIRRFFCDDTACGRRTFAEQVLDLTAPYVRRTPLLCGILEKIALALGGRPGARMTRLLAVGVSGTTLLRLVRALPVPEIGTVTVVGVDDFAFRKGRNYGSIIVGMHTGRPVDLLPDRRADSFADWLRVHPGAEVVCRDRASGYAEGARLGAPDAIQVADRFHLLYNLTQAVDRVVRAHRPCLKDRPEAEAVAQPRPPTDGRQGRRAQTTRQRHAEIHVLHDGGRPPRAHDPGGQCALTAEAGASSASAWSTSATSSSTSVTRTRRRAPA